MPIPYDHDRTMSLSNLLRTWLLNNYHGQSLQKRNLKQFGANVFADLAIEPSFNSVTSEKLHQDRVFF